MSTSGAAIDLSGVTKTFGSLTAVDGLDLTIPRGALYGFIGPNGAGKTTAIRMIMSILLPDSGELRVLGHASALEAKDRIGYLPEERGLYRKMKVAPYLTFIARLKGAPERGLRDRVHAAIERIGLKGVEGKRCEELCDHVVMIHRGRKMLDDPVSSILRPHDSRALTFELLDPKADVRAVAALPEIARCVPVESRYEAALRDGVDAGRAMQAVLAAVPVARIELKRRSLEDVFVAIVAGTEGGARTPGAADKDAA